MKGEKTIAYKTAYFGKVWVGQDEPKAFTVVFDTGSGHFILPSTACTSETCMKHERYNRTASSSAVDIEYDGTLIKPGALERDQVAIAFGTGEVLGEFVREVVCVDGTLPRSCVTLRVVLASKMTSDPFSFFAFDGVMGLGLDSLALDPHFSFFGQMASQHPQMEPRFSVFLSRSGEENFLSFGGYEERLAEGPISWAPVAMASLGYWQVQIKSVRIGDYSLPECEDGSCRAIVDTGTSLLGVPKQAARALHRSLARPVPEDLQGDGQSDIDCRRLPGLSIDFDLGDTKISLLPEDYSRPVPFNMTVPSTNKSRLFCRSLLLPVDMAEPLGPKVFIWGEPVLKRYYTVYDLAEKRVGFALAKQSEQPAGSGLPVVGAPPAGSLLSGAPMSSAPPAQVTV